MLAKILSSTSTFNGVSYNTAKTQNQKGELIKFKNFGYLQNSQKVTPDELKAFLIAHSSINSKVKDKQFHAVISCKGREYDKHQLTNIAESWLHKMGYGQNPYLIVHHSDTKNNHVHIVSTRIGGDGKKIKDNMERVKAQSFLQEIMKKDPKIEMNSLLEDLNKYQYSTLSQVKFFFELRGYGCKEIDDKLELFKYGTLQGEIPLAHIQKQLESYATDKQQKNRIKAIFHKYLQIYDADPKPYYEPLKGNRIGKLLGYRSQFSEFLKEKLGIEIIYHGKAGKPPYGYSIIDYNKKHIYKGSEIMPLKDLMLSNWKEAVKKVLLPDYSDKVAFEKTHNREYVFAEHHKPDYAAYRMKLLSAFEDFSTFTHGLNTYQLRVIPHLGKLYLEDKNNAVFVNLKAVFSEDQYQEVHSKIINSLSMGDTFRYNSLRENRELPSLDKGTSGLFNVTNSFESDEKIQVSNSFSLQISDDVDDDALFRKGKRRGKELKVNRGT